MLVQKAIITIYVGDVTEYLGRIAKTADPGATLITNSNYKKLRTGTYYVSIGDLDTIVKFSIVLHQADTIIYTPPATWSDQKKNYSKMQEWTERYLVAFSDKKTIQGFKICPPDDKETILTLADTRRTDNPQLWIAGCSISYGSHIESNDRYGQLIANHLKLPVSFLTCPSSSLSWATDQILRSDIRANDIVIWGLTTTDRFLYFKNNKITHVTYSTYVTDPLFRHRVDIEFLDSQQLMYQAVTGIHQVINFCKKINANLILAQVLGRGLETYLHDYKNYIMLAGQFGQNIEDRFLDLGGDQMHPGPLTHKWYYQQILNKYYELYKNE